jgi:hypothetical protein
MWHVVALAGLVGSADFQLVEPPADAPHVNRVAHIIYLNRCVGGCLIGAGANDARNNTSSIIGQTSSISEFQYSDTIWDAVVACVRDEFSPYDIEVVTDEPASGDYLEAIVAGDPQEIGQPSTTLGYSPMATDCSSNSNWIGFAFANIHGSDPVLELCATIGHEVGHMYGLDHTLPCKDPMSYEMGCGAKHFLNLAMECGEFGEARPCQCSEKLNTHNQLFERAGAGVTPPAPAVTILAPTAGAAVNDGFITFAEVIEDRVVQRVEFWINGFPWRRASGDPEETVYQYKSESQLPDGILDIEVKAYNDLQLEGVSSMTVQKGEPCTSASQCLDEQECNDGRCEWPPPTVELGEDCAIDADCVTYLCESDGEHSLCTDYCVLGDETTCQNGYTCLEAGDHGVCWPDELIPHGGCCSTGGGGAGSGLLGFAVAGLIIRRRGRRPAARRC